MPRKSYRRNKRGGNPNLPYNAPVKFGGRRHKKSKRGGAAYSSAATYGQYVNGTENAQYNRVFSQTGPYASNQSNVSIGAQGQNGHFIDAPNSASLALIQRAGSKRKHTKKRRGGFLGQVINQAIVPFGILGMQQSYKRKHRNTSSKSRRRYR
jgi:hypothetical protein